jgi:hypothetical protein
MKTPREFLFERHRKIESRLDAIRRKALATLPAAKTVDASEPVQTRGPWLQTALKKLWLELIWPSRRAWAGMAVLWLAVLAANLHMKVTSPALPAARVGSVHEVAQAIQEERRLLAELLQPVNSPVALPAQPARPNPRPRSERLTPLKAC